MQGKIKILKNIDYVLVLSTISLLALSLLVLASASSNATADPYFYLNKHIRNILIGILFLIIATTIPYNIFMRMYKVLYLMNIALLLLVLFFGREVHGSVSWIYIKSFSFQPSEIAKIIYILTFASFLAKNEGKLQNLFSILKCFLYLTPLLVLLLLQPDLGTALVFIAITVVMMFIAGANPKILFPLCFAGLFGIIIWVYAHLNFGVYLPLKEYQLMRLIVFLNPYNDGSGGLDGGYNIIQSLVAIGSGGLTGKGLFSGTQSQLSFLPFPYTDFIFSVIGEELGFFGANLIFGLYLIFIFRGIRIAYTARDLYGSLIVTGFLGMMCFHILENVGMTISIMPITGIPMPFFSYGGTNMWANLMGVGLCLNVYLRKKQLKF